MTTVSAHRPAAIVLAVLLLAAGPLPAPPRVAGVTGVPRLEQRYELSGTLDVAAATLGVTADVIVTNRDRRPLDALTLALVPRALGFVRAVGPVTVDGREVEAAWTTSISLLVPLDGLAPGASATVRVPYRLALARAPDAFTARTSVENGVLSLGHWFPIVSTEHDVYGLGDPQISFTAETISLDLTTTTALPRDAVACPGLRVAPARTGTRWRCEVDDVRDFSFVVNPSFALTTRTVGGVELRVHAETVDGESTADLAADALARLAELYGPYPWPDLVLAEVGSAGGFSMEYPRMIHLTRDKVADPYVVYHEVAHQWFYAQVGNDQQAEPWLDEAFADFSARELMGIGAEHCSGRPVDSSVFAWDAGPTSGGDWTSCDGYFHAVFYRGTEFLHAVRAAMGEEAFFGALRSWVRRQRFAFATEAELLGHLAARSKRDLRPIFNAYLADYVVSAPRPVATIRKARTPAGSP